MRGENYSALYKVEGLALTRADLHPRADEFMAPCDTCGFCPYGILVENFPLGRRRDSFSCETFGHDCPVFYLGESMS